MKKLRLCCFFCFLIFGLWAYFYGESLPLNVDYFSEWFSGKFVLIILAGVFLTVLILSFFEREKEKPHQMATPLKRR